MNAPKTMALLPYFGWAKLYKPQATQVVKGIAAKKARVGNLK